MLKKKFLQFYVLISFLSISTIAILKITKQTYGVNDDVIIQNWLSGFYTGAPEFMIRGSATPRITFGFIVSNLYGLISGINWYSIFLLGLTLVSWYLLGLLAFRSNNFLAITVYFLLSFLHLLWFIPSPTYTAAAVIISFSTLIYILKQISDDNVGIFLIPISMIYVFSFMIRPESFLLGSAVTIPFILFTVIKDRKLIRKNIKFIFAFILVTISLIGFDVIFERTYYNNNSNWASYKEWEQSRYKIQANAPEKAVLESPEKYGWTKAEAEIFENYNSIDSKYFTANKLNTLFLDSQSTTIFNLEFLKKAHQQIFDSDVNWEWKRLIQLISFAYLLFLFLSIPKSANYLLLANSSLAIIYVIMIYVAGFLRQPERVQVSIIFMSILVCWASFVFSNDSNSRNQIDQFSILSFLIVVLFTASTFNQASYLKLKVAGASNVFWETESTYLSKFPKDSIFVGNASQFRNNWSSPYKLEYLEIEKRIMSFGWHNFSPHWIKRAQNLGLDPNNMFSSVVDDPRVYWVSDSESMEYIVTYMKEQKYSFSGPEEVGEMEFVGNEYKIWKFNPGD